MAADPYIYAFKVLAHQNKFTIENAYKYKYNFGAQVENIVENLLRLEQAIALTNEELGLHNAMAATLTKMANWLNFDGEGNANDLMAEFNGLLTQLWLFKTGEYYDFTAMDWTQKHEDAWDVLYKTF